MTDVISANTESTEQRGRTSADPLKGIDGQCHGQGAKHTKDTQCNAEHPAQTSARKES